MMGIENQFLDTPAVSTFLPPTRVPYIYLVVMAGLTFFFGIRAPLVCVIVWYIYHHQQNNADATSGAPAASRGGRTSGAR